MRKLVAHCRTDSVVKTLALDRATSLGTLYTAVIRRYLISILPQGNRKWAVRFRLCSWRTAQGDLLL